MLLKTADNKDYQIKELEGLLAAATGDRKSRVEQELRIIRAGFKGEQEAAYLIDFDFKNLDFYAVIHDLRLEVGGRVAQIDHLVISRCLDCFVLETKYLRGGMKVTEDGEFLRWNDYKKTFEGMASPLAQNDRHVSVLREAFGLIDMPTRLGLRLQPTFHSYVLVSPEARIDRPQKFDTSRIIKADVFKQTVLDKYDKESFLGTVGSMAKVISVQTLEQLARQIVTLHKPFRMNVAAKFSTPEPVKTERSTNPLPSRPPEPVSRAVSDAPASIASAVRARFSMASLVTTSNATAAVPIRRPRWFVTSRAIRRAFEKKVRTSSVSAKIASRVLCISPTLESGRLVQVVASWLHSMPALRRLSLTWSMSSLSVAG
jgi:hypothetical protein